MGNMTAQRPACPLPAGRSGTGGLWSITWLCGKYPRVSLVGFSTGCLLALHLAFAHPVHKLVLLAPFFAIRHRWYYLFRPEQYLNSLGWLLDDVPRFRLPIRDGNVRALAEKVAYFRSFNLTAVRSALELIKRTATARKR
jgi:carboxylesterase